jgi:predicted MFS family arabinose efflux permease
MLGLRILSDNTAGPRQGRFLSFYTACYALGSSASVLLAGLVGEPLDWRAAFAASAAATAVALALAWWGIPKADSDRAAPPQALLDFRPVLRNRAAMGYILAYSAHCYELFGLRAWLVAFLAFASPLIRG